MQVTEVVASVLEARRTGARLVLRGAGTLGQPPLSTGRPVSVLELSRLDGEVELDPENLSVSVPASCSLAELRQVLARSGLFYPPAEDLEPAGTVGGHLSAATCGPWRLGRGTTRDWVLGLEAVTGEGTCVRTGSGVVKNVAGLDLTKLLIGSRGRLGAITRAYLRLAPLPEQRSTVGAQFGSPSQALQALPALVGSALAPTAIELQGSVLVVGLEGSELDQNRRLNQAAQALLAVGGELIPAPPSLAVLPLPCPEGAVRIRAGLPAGRAGAWVGALPAEAPLHGHAGSGVYRCVLPADLPALKRLHALATELGGYLVQEAGAAIELEPRRAHSELEARVAAAFDPDSIFSEEGAHGQY